MVDSPPKQCSNSNRLDVPSLDSRVFTNVTPMIINKVHQQQLQRMESNEHNMLQLVQIFGGIDQILSHYLNETNGILTQDQLEQIYQLITTPRKFQQKSSMKSHDLSTIKQSQTFDMEDFRRSGSQLTYNFWTKNNIFHMCLDEKWSKYASLIFTNDFLWIFMFLCIGFRLIECTEHIYSNLWRLLFRYIFGIIWLIFLIGIIFNMNRKAIQLTMKSFTWWLKCYFAIQFGVSWLIYFYFIDREFVQYEQKSLSWFIADIICTVGYILGFAVMGLLADCINTPSRNIRIICCFIAALAVSYISVYYSFIHSYDIKHVTWTLKIVGDIEIPFSSISMMTSSAGNMTIFVWRMVFAMIFGKDKCVMIRYHPYYEWTETEIQRKTDEQLKQMTQRGILLSKETVMEMAISTREYNPKTMRSQTMINHNPKGPYYSRTNVWNHSKTMHSEMHSTIRRLNDAVMCVDYDLEMDGPMEVHVPQPKKSPRSKSKSSNRNNNKGNGGDDEEKDNMLKQDDDTSDSDEITIQF